MNGTADNTRGEVFVIYQIIYKCQCQTQVCSWVMGPYYISPNWHNILCTQRQTLMFFFFYFWSQGGTKTVSHTGSVSWNMLNIQVEVFFWPSLRTIWITSKVWITLLLTNLQHPLWIECIWHPSVTSSLGSSLG